MRLIFFDNHLVLFLILVVLLSSIYSGGYPRLIMSTSDNDDNNDEENGNDPEGQEASDHSKDDLNDLDLIEVCCSWSNQISDGVLEYSISGDTRDNDKREAVLSAITGWNNVIKGLQLVNSAANEGSESGVDIEIMFGEIGDQDDNNGNDLSPGEYAPGGETQIDIDEKGFISHIKITISGSVFGHEIGKSELEQIAKHEIGHALGLGHANFDNNLMSVATDIGTGEISGCEVYGVLVANQWKLMNNKAQPEYPAGQYVVC
jgi:hypothetical protein